MRTHSFGTALTPGIPRAGEARHDRVPLAGLLGMEPTHPGQKRSTGSDQ
jgi:hypothetical protein